jgi:pimeloyl-ACP methyl ester carboxylesterase
MTTIEMNGAQVAYSDAGTGEPILLIHCSSASGNEWRSLCETLGQRFRPIAPDQWGCGRSDPWMGRGSFNLAEEAAPILRIIDSIGIPVHLVGHSYGGAVALRVARERPQMIRSLTLVEPSSFHVLRNGGAVEQALFCEIADVAEAVKEAVTTGDYWGGMARFVDYWSGEGAWSTMSHEARLKMSQRLAKVVLDFRALFDESATLEDYGTLAHRTLFLCGEHSPGPSRRIVEMLAAVMPRARIERIPGAGHMSPVTHPDAVNTAIREHVCQTTIGEVPQARAA